MVLVIHSLVVLPLCVGLFVCSCFTMKYFVDVLVWQFKGNYLVALLNLTFVFAFLCLCYVVSSSWLLSNKLLLKIIDIVDRMTFFHKRSCRTLITAMF